MTAVVTSALRTGERSHVWFSYALDAVFELRACAGRTGKILNVAN